MIINNVAFAEIEFGNDIIFVPHIIKGENDNGIITKFIDFFGLLKLEPDSRFSDGGPLRILCTGDTYRYIIPYKIDEFCKENGCQVRLTKTHKMDAVIRRLLKV